MPDRNNSLPPLEWIRVFEAAARCGSFTAAAAETGITQSAVSQRIAQLEKRLGTTLFHRHPRAITLTIEGEAWLPHVGSALDTLRDSSQALFGSGRRPLTISASQSVIDLWLTPRLAALTEIAGGQLAVQTMVLGSHDAPEDDVIRIRYGTGDWPHPYKLPLYPENIAPIAAPALTARGGHWNDWPRIACSGPRPGWPDWVARFGGGTTPVPHLRFDTFLSALGAARTGSGVLLGSLALCQDDLAAGRLEHLGPDCLEHHATYWIIAGQEALTRAQWADLTDIIA
ncbi:LysR family transcriptional regulator [Phaeobacter porticola]|uniref:Transcriptional regulator, lysR family n=1 Tax=Phaeobacter porticola TaxID=1844006 RepID=A0A1L3I7M5_9RHOB|nr:LysR family transcriptional regulator [Phaeobacter porticola]APG48047.1 transcriptional regulator, lysR family [Phaeobacter porticola]